MNKEQKQFLASRTCYILDSNSNLEEDLLTHGIPKKIVNKISEALNLIYEVNELCHKK